MPYTHASDSVYVLSSSSYSKSSFRIRWTEAFKSRIQYGIDYSFYLISSKFFSSSHFVFVSLSSLFYVLTKCPFFLYKIVFVQDIYRILIFLSFLTVSRDMTDSVTSVAFASFFVDSENFFWFLFCQCTDAVFRHFW